MSVFIVKIILNFNLAKAGVSPYIFFKVLLSNFKYSVKDTHEGMKRGVKKEWR